VGRRAAPFCAGLALLLCLAACGGGGGGPAGSSSHDSPDGAVRGLVNALAAGDTKGALDWIAPGERSQFSSALDEARSLGLKISFSVKQFSVVSSSVDRSDGNRALVRYSGTAQACVDGTTGGRQVHTCNPVQSQSGQAQSDTFVCVRSDGRWYVSINAATQS
jgi:hypothetical protein